MFRLNLNGRTKVGVLFDDLPVKQAFYLESTMRVARHFIECHCHPIGDCPGNVTVNTLGLSLADVSTIVFVIHSSIAVYQINPYINFKVFVHKAERLQEDNNIDESPEFPLKFPLTSIYDHSVREAFSRMLYKLIDPLPYIEELLNIFCSVCAFIDTYLHRSYIATTVC
ncbi:hypothetical protein EV424DRAFT_1476310 [Suillus variegatus]|nr:hypothetical protein EV424DRAFT_1476310 [Suillus variegatus]